MIKTFLILIFLQNFLLASQQIILVVSSDFNSSKAKLICYEDAKVVFKTMDVNIGKNGLGWGIGEFKLTQKNNEPIKQEGDKKAPAGIFKLTSIFGYGAKQEYHLKYLHLSKKLICVDDSESKHYNKIIEISNIRPNSFEQMRRDDGQYELGILKALMQKSLLSARLKGYRIAQTMVEIGSLETLLYYKKLGFKEVKQKECELYKEKFGRPGLVLLAFEF